MNCGGRKINEATKNIEHEHANSIRERRVFLLFTGACKLVKDGGKDAKKWRVLDFEEVHISNDYANSCQTSKTIAS